MFKTLTNTAKLPERATLFSAGFDVYADEDIVIEPGETKAVGLGIAIDGILFKYNNQEENEEFMRTHFLELHPRSSMRMKGLIILPGIIDMDYRDEIKMIIHNPYSIIDYNHNTTTGDNSNPIVSNDNFIISKGDKIGQLILKRHEGILLPGEYTKEEKRTGGFGSTGQ